MSGLVEYGDSSDEDDEVRRSSASPVSQPQDSRAQHARAVTNGTNNPISSDHEVIKDQTGPIGPQLEQTRQSENGSPLEHLPHLASTAITSSDMLQTLTTPNIPVNAIPPSPPGSPNPASNARFARFLELKTKGIHFNADLAKKSSYCNPSLFSNLLERAGLQESDQYATSLPTNLWDVSQFPDSAYKESLAKGQQQLRGEIEELKRTQSAAGKRVLEFVAQTEPTASSHRSTAHQGSEQHSRTVRDVKKSKVS